MWQSGIYAAEILWLKLNIKSPKYDCNNKLYSQTESWNCTKNNWVMSIVHWVCEYDSNAKNLIALLYTLPLAIFPKLSTYCPVSRTKSLNSRSLPVSVVINPEECSVWSNKQLWSGIGPLVLLQSQFSVISCTVALCQQQWENLREKAK